MNQRIRCAVLCLLMMMAGTRQVMASPDQPFIVESVNSRLNETVYFLNVVFTISLPEHIVSAVDQGFDLPLVMEIEAFQRKSMWFDEKIVFIKQQYRVGYHSLLDEFSVLDVNSGIRRYYQSLDKAMESLTVLMDYPAIDKNTLTSGTRYALRLRFGVDGAELPLPLKSSSLWRKKWNIKSEWFKWELQP